MSVADAGRHTQAVQNSLRMADEAAQRGDYPDALGWLETLLAIGEQLPGEYQRKQTAWQDKTEARPLPDPIGGL